MRQAVSLLRPGGVLVYSTCTVTVEENEDQVAWLLHTFPDITLEQQVSPDSPFLNITLEQQVSPDTPFLTSLWINWSVLTYLS